MTPTKRIPMPDLSELYLAAQAARAQSYSPYSKFSVGAAIQTADGRRFSGANIENASYGLSNCAERTAVFHAVQAGAKNITAVAIAGPAGVTIAPCGACRQVLSEFARPDTPVHYGRADGGMVETTVGDLLPGAFTPLMLDAAAKGSG